MSFNETMQNTSSSVRTWVDANPMLAGAIAAGVVVGAAAAAAGYYSGKKAGSNVNAKAGGKKAVDPEATKEASKEETTVNVKKTDDGVEINIEPGNAKGKK